MITKVLQSNDLRATLDYVYQEGKTPLVVESSCLESSREGAYEDIKEYIDLRPEIKKPVFHAVLSVPEHEELDLNTWKAIADEYTRKMGFGSVPYVAVKHQDTAHQHIHIVASRVDIRGQLISDSFSAYRSQEIARELEAKHELTPVPSSWEVDRRRERQSEYHKNLRTSEPAQREVMREIISETLEKHGDMVSFSRALEQRGVTLVPKLTQDESKVVGAWFEAGEVRIAGSKIDRSYSWNRLEQRLDFDPERDLSRLRRTPETPGRVEQTAPSVSAGHRPEVLATSPRQTPLSAQQEDVRKAEAPPTPSSHTTPAVGISLKESEPEPVREVSSRVGERPPTLPTPAPLSPSPDSARPHTQLNPQDVARIQSALERAPTDQGWKAWSEALRAQGVEPIPKGSVQDTSQLRGMYFAHGETLIPGSKVAREYSLAQLEQRLGAHDAARDQGTFKQVHIPGRGTEDFPSPSSKPLQSVAPHAQTAPPRTPEAAPYQDTLSPVVSKLREQGYALQVEPRAYQGYVRAEVQNARGERFVLLSPDAPGTPHPVKESCLVRLDERTQLMEGRLEQGRLVAVSHLPVGERFPQGTAVQWHQNGERRVLLSVPGTTREVSPANAEARPLETPRHAPHRTELSSHDQRSPSGRAGQQRVEQEFQREVTPIAPSTEVHPHKDTLTPVMTHLEERGVTLRRDPFEYQGYVRAELQDAWGERFVLLSADAPGTPNPRPEMALVRRDVHTHTLECDMENGRLVHRRTREPGVAFTPREAVQWYNRAGARTLVVLPEHPTRERAQDVQRDSPAPSSSTLTPHAHEERTAARHTTSSPVSNPSSSQQRLVTRDEYIASAQQQGLKVHTLTEGEQTRGVLLRDEVVLREGSYRLIERVDKQLMLVPSTHELKAREGEKLHLRMRHDASLAITPDLLRRDRDHER